jgi:hypothetical protein
MKLLRTTDEAIVFSLNATERDVLDQILALYPLVPAAHQPLSQSLRGEPAAEAQRLLDEALAEQRSHHQTRVKTWLADAKRFRRTKTGYTLTVRREDAEWLLQVLNDIRVGSWLLLGSPEDRQEPGDVDPKLNRIWAAMEISGMFEMFILHGLEGRSPI